MNTQKIIALSRPARSWSFRLFYVRTTLPLTLAYNLTFDPVSLSFSYLQTFKKSCKKVGQASSLQALLPLGKGRQVMNNYLYRTPGR